MEPINRREVFLNALCADKSCGLEPVSREEILLKRLVEAEANEGGGSEKVVKWIVPETEFEGTPNPDGFVGVEVQEDCGTAYFGERYIVNVNGTDYKVIGELKEGRLVELSHPDIALQVNFSPVYEPHFSIYFKGKDGTNTYSVRQEFERSSKSNIIGTLIIDNGTSNRDVYANLIDTDFSTIYKALESGFVGYLAVRDWQACAQMGRDFTDIGTIVHYSADSIGVVYGSGYAVIKSDGTIEFQ